MKKQLVCAFPRVSTPNLYLFQIHSLLHKNKARNHSKTKGGNHVV